MNESYKNYFIDSFSDNFYIYKSTKTSKVGCKLKE